MEDLSGKNLLFTDVSLESFIFFFTALNLGNLQKKESVLIIEKIRDGWNFIVNRYIQGMQR
jgi:hypothetical protein